MTNSTNIRTALDTIASLHNQIKEDTKVIKRDFFEFIEDNVPGGYINAPDSPFGEHKIEVMEDIDRFYLVTGFKSDTGIIFVHDIYDGSESVEIPFAYIDDPEGWKSEILERISRDRRIAEKLYTDNIPSEHFRISSVAPIHPVPEYDEIRIELENISSLTPNYGYHTFHVKFSDHSVSWVSRDLQEFLDSVNKPMRKNV